jgi:hypothetical protein
MPLERPFDSDEEYREVQWAQKDECDWDGLRAHGERIQNGLELFGKYFQALWD